MFLLFTFFSNDAPTPEIYTLSLHDALPIRWCTTSRSRICRCASRWTGPVSSVRMARRTRGASISRICAPFRSEEHTSELQSHSDLVCRLLLEKKKQQEKQPVRVENVLVACT